LWEEGETSLNHAMTMMVAREEEKKRAHTTSSLERTSRFSEVSLRTNS